MKPKNKKKIAIKTLIIVGIVLFALLLPKISSAALIDFSKVGQFIVRQITSLILSFFALLVSLAGKFFDATLQLGFQDHKDVIEEGWRVTRDLSNMFFILFMVVVAFATILRFEKYGIKQLLPKIIIIALLINFSLVICKVFVDISNISANFFIKDAANGAKALGKDKASISGALVDGLNLTKVLLPVDCNDFRKQAEQCSSICAQSEGGPPSPGCISDCEEEKEQAYQDCKEGLNNLKGAGSEATFGNMIVSTIFGSIILCIAAFVLFAGGIMLVIRVIFLWFLIMLVPFAFICYILPALKRISDDWWKKFIQYCFFAPAYAFFIWLAVKISVEKKLSKMAALVDNTLAKEPTMNAFTRSMENIMGFLFMGGILIGGLIAANKMGIAGADRALALGKKWGGGAVNWAKRTSMRPVAALGTAARAGALRAGGKLFGDTKLGRRMEARAGQLRQAATERPEHKKYRAMAEKMSDKDILREVDTAKGPRAFIATQIAA